MNTSDRTTSTDWPDLPSQNLQREVPGSGRDLRIEPAEVTPQLARQWLTRNRRNRRVRPERVTRYAEQIKDGEWMVSPDAIAFDYKGKLINGQHRLKAIIEAGQPARHIVAFGLQPDAFKISDVGVKRTGGDILRIEGFKNPEELAAAARLMVLWKQGRLDEANKYENVRNGALVEMANQCSQVDCNGLWTLPETVRRVNDRDKGRYTGIVPRSMLAFALFAYQFRFTERTRSFFDGITRKQGHVLEDWSAYGDDESAEQYENPVNLYTDVMRRKHDSLTRDRILGYLIKAMNMYCLQKPHKKLRFRETDNFPEIAAELPPSVADQRSQFR